MTSSMPLTQMLFSVHGRITRSQYWLYTIGKIIVLGAILGVVIGISSGASEDGRPGALALIILAAVYIAYIWMAICISAKRCHDRNRSGWFQLVALIPLIGGIWLLVELGFLDGTQGPNEYGPSPKGIGGNQVANVFS